MEKTLIIIKPDALQRNLVGEILTRFEKKGLKVVGMKMMELDDLKLEEHYAHIKDKPFFGDIKKYMKSSPVIILVLEGTQVIEACRIICGSTKGIEADAGTIRGDLAMSNFNLVHASDSLKSSEEEIKRLFNEDELFDYSKLDTIMIYED
ncbi:nucleoside-diphosphate kinase [bacterium]|jgi:nucleoside-diphosphate kinase|nr:nucleoside-diphosphate kinase [bacterium]MBT4121372.1 nucleoside-diphosphate kinase [bacterium]MBT4335054.1 nucleoside-diphosphate kinase [bacterium]MBT4495253.1 nucleoside-diphosphate kinase [bacterium]MBT4763862.1 nucleoside-diphosphate kinase [bacterium]